MRKVKVFLSIAALANLAVTLWHLYLTVEMHPGLLGTTPVRIALQTGTLTIVGLVLLWTRYPKIGSLVLIVVLALGFVMGCLEHFFRRRSLQCVRRRQWTLGPPLRYQCRATCRRAGWGSHCRRAHARSARLRRFGLRHTLNARAVEVLSKHLTTEVIRRCDAA